MWIPLLSLAVLCSVCGVDVEWRGEERRGREERGVVAEDGRGMCSQCCFVRRRASQVAGRRCPGRQVADGCGVSCGEWVCCGKVWCGVAVGSVVLA